MESVLVKKQRESGVELLRILALGGVIMIHFSDKALPLLSVSGGINLSMLLVWRTIASNAVNIFLIISGYFMSTSYRRSLGKPLSLILQVSIYYELAYLVEVACGIYPLQLRSVVSSLIPDSYYTTLFVVVYFVSPYINKLMNGLTKQELRRFVGMMCLLFSLFSMPSLLLEEATNKQWMGLNTIGAWGSQQGFNIINFLLCYIIGAYIRMGELPEWTKYRKKKLVGIVLCIALLYSWTLVNQFILHTQGLRSSWVYDNPIVIMYSVLMFLLFKDFHFSSKLINSLSKAVYATFLIHCAVIHFVHIDEVCLLPWYEFVCYYLLFTVVMFVLSYFVFMIYEKFTQKIFKSLDNYCFELNREL